MLGSSAIVFLAFTSASCGPCQQFKKDFSGDQAIVVVDIKEDRELAESYQVSTVPTIVALRDGQEIGRRVGYRGKEPLARWMERWGE